MRFDWKLDAAFARLGNAAQTVVKQMGRGAVKICDERLGFSEGHLAQALRNRSLRLWEFFWYLRQADVDLQHFFQHTLAPLMPGYATADDGAAAKDRVTPGAPPPRRFIDPVEVFATQARAVRKDNPYRHLGLLLRTFETGDGRPLPRCDPAEREMLDILDAERYCDPKPVVPQAAQICHRALETGHGELALRAAGVLASALRLCMQLDSAEVLLWDAYRQATRRNLKPVVGDLLRRMVYVASDRGDHELGFCLALQAAHIFCRLGHHQHLGQAHVDCGVMRFHCGHFQEALDLFEDALRDLPEADHSHRCTALQVGAFAHLALGDRARAEHGLRQAAAYLPAGPHYEGRLLWLRAALAAHCGDADAEALYCQAIETFGTTYPADTAVCSMELVHLFLTLERQDKAQGLADEMKAFAFELPDGTVVQKAVWDLVGLSTLTPRRVHRILEGVGEASNLLEIERIGGRMR